jgi:hypothetical protein
MHVLVSRQELLRLIYPEAGPDRLIAIRNKYEAFSD